MNSLLLSMASFALVASITPGPVNVVAFGSGVQYGFGAAMRHVSGATWGFSVLLLLTGLGLREVLAQWPGLAAAVQWGGIGFLLYMAYKLGRDDGLLGTGADSGKPPSFLFGWVMQWLNPKAWLAAVAGMGAYAASGEPVLVWQFTVLYFCICYASIACWAYAGHHFRDHFAVPHRIRMLNRAMALVLALSALYLVAG